MKQRSEWQVIRTDFWFEAKQLSGPAGVSSAMCSALDIAGSAADYLIENLTMAPLRIAPLEISRPFTSHDCAALKNCRRLDPNRGCHPTWLRRRDNYGDTLDTPQPYGRTVCHPKSFEPLEIEGAPRSMVSVRKNNRMMQWFGGDHAFPFLLGVSNVGFFCGTVLALCGGRFPRLARLSSSLGTSFSGGATPVFTCQAFGGKCPPSGGQQSFSLLILTT